MEQRHPFPRRVRLAAIAGGVLQPGADPRLDGFGIIRPYFDRDITGKAASPQLRRTMFFIWFMMIWNVPQLDVFLHR